LITAATIHFVPLILSVLLDISSLLMTYGRYKRTRQIVQIVRRHPAVTVQQQQIADALPDVGDKEIDGRDTDNRDTDETKPADLDTLILILRSELADLRPHDQAAATPLAEPLTDRELDVLHLMAQGLSNPEIAGVLVISVGTVKAHTNRIYSKLQAGNRVAAVEQARLYGLLNR
jgi:ATP/maltotriose-dependent transcriptional regulator MalT